MRDILKNLNLFVDGKGYAGLIEEFNQPKLVAKTEEFRAGGMAAPVKLELGMEALDADFTLVSYSKDVLALWGVQPGQTVPLVVRGFLESADGSSTAVAITMRGRITELDGGTWKPGEKPSMKVTLSLNYYKLEHGGAVVQEIDVLNMVHVVNGVDRLAAQRAALGM